MGYADLLSPKRNLGGQLGAIEYSEGFDDVVKKARQLANWMRDPDVKVMAFTGAGISTSCGIPDFRGPKGVWTLRKKKQPLPQGITPFEFAKPSFTHQAISALVACGKVVLVVSQNVDGLHLRSGVPRDKMAELHGNCFAERCTRCTFEYLRPFSMETVNFKPTGRRCAAAGCGAELVDNILDWDTALPEDELELSVETAATVGVNLVLGTSLQIEPANEIPGITRDAGGRMVIVNLQKTPKDRRASLIVRCRVDPVMALLMQELQIQVPPYTRTDSVIISHTITGAAQSLQHPHQQLGNKECCSSSSSSTAAATHPDVNPEQDQTQRSSRDISAPDPSDPPAQATAADPTHPRASPAQGSTAAPSTQPHTTLPPISPPATGTLPATAHPPPPSLPATAPRHSSLPPFPAPSPAAHPPPGLAPSHTPSVTRTQPPPTHAPDPASTRPTHVQDREHDHAPDPHPSPSKGPTCSITPVASGTAPSHITVSGLPLSQHAVSLRVTLTLNPWADSDKRLVVFQYDVSKTGGASIAAPRRCTGSSDERQAQHSVATNGDDLGQGGSVSGVVCRREGGHEVSFVSQHVVHSAAEVVQRLRDDPPDVVMPRKRAKPGEGAAAKLAAEPVAAAVREPPSRVSSRQAARKACL
ncbi:MAG: hypothetical protein WDW36_003652 [Sanguina aurantia]